MFSSGMTTVLAAEKAPSAIPVSASLSPADQTKSGVGNTASFTKRLSWGGGTTNTYNVSYYDGMKVGFSDPAANYYSHNYTETYNKGSLSTRTWNTNLYVSNGTSDTAYGSVTLSDR